ncbi:MAG TPA: hypothetical protein VMT28_01780 [Terriglobales bacterium]|nr:hypothetical protein [Terriglobales bacterium]
MRTATSHRDSMGPVLVPGGPRDLTIQRKHSRLDWAIGALCLVFILILGEAAYLEPGIRTLHLFEWLIYLLVIVLALDHSKWGYGLGLSTSAFWLGLGIFGTPFVREGIQTWAGLLRTGQITGAMAFLAVPAAIDQFLLMAFCLLGYWRLQNKRWSDLGILAGSAGISIGYLATIVALFWPRLQFR